MNWQDKLAASHAIIDEAIELYKPIAVVGLFSGGHDSLTACHVASQHTAFTTCLHIDTGIGVPETQQFVIDTCDRQGWPLKVYRAAEYKRGDGTPDPQIYEELIKAHGFPGPPHHYKMYCRLKERPLVQFIRETKVGHKRSDCILFISGCRSAESERRMGNVERIQKESSKVWSAVIHDWDKADCNRYLADHKIPRNPVVDRLCKSGECLCGAFAKKGELLELAAEYPKVAQRIRNLEREVWGDFPWGWEGRQPKWYEQKRAGYQFFEFFDELDDGPPSEMMCTDCKAQAVGQ